MHALRSLDFDLETFTPLISGGADMQAELRPPSFRGLMRFWLRALLNGLLEGDLDRLRRAEAAIFGSARHSSSIVLRLIRGDVAVGRLPHHPPPGMQYLLWAAYISRRTMIPPGERFTLRLQTRPLLRRPPFFDDQVLDEEMTFNLALASFWLMVRLGTVGFRQRRGAGTIRVLDHPPDWPADLPSPVCRATTPAELAAELSTGLSRLREWVGLPAPSTFTNLAELDTLHPDTCRIYVLDTVFSSYQEAMDQVGSAFKAFRLRHPGDYDLVKSVLTGGQAIIRTIKRAIFGLPLPFFFSSIYQEARNQGVPSREARRRASATILPGRGDRRASPLFFRFLPLAGAEGTCVPAFLLFPSRFLPDMNLQVRPSDRSLPPVTVQAPADFSFIEEWFTHLEREVAPRIPVTFS